MFSKKSKKNKSVTSMHFINKIYNGEKINSHGISLCRDLGIDPESMQIKTLNHFFKPGVTEDVVKMSFMRYEERRKLKLALLEEFDGEKVNMTYDNGQNYMPRSVKKPKKSAIGGIMLL